MLLLNTEDGEVQHRARLLPGPLVAISWTEAGGGSGQPRSGGDGASAGGASASSQLGEDRPRRMLAPPPPPVPTAAAGLAVGYATCGKHGGGGQAWPADPARLAVLACASADGGLAVCTSGLFPLASLHLPALMGSSDVAVLRLATAPSLRELAVCWRDSNGSLRLSTISLEQVGGHAPQLHRLALAASHVGSLLEGCQATLQAACKEWGSGQRELDDSRGRLVSLAWRGAGCAVPCCTHPRLQPLQPLLMPRPLPCPPHRAWRRPAS